jgi:hypothetical protein
MENCTVSQGLSAKTHLLRIRKGVISGFSFHKGQRYINDVCSSLTGCYNVLVKVSFLTKALKPRQGVFVL